MARGDLNASQFGQNSRGNTVSDRELETAIVRVLTSKMGLSERIVQKLQELAGERGEQAMPRSAVRRSDLSAIGKAQPLGSQEATAAPTAAEFNALREDVRRLYEVLERVAKSLSPS